MPHYGFVLITINAYQDIKNMAKPKITADMLQAFHDKVAAGASQVKAAKEFGFTVDAFRSAAKRLEMPWPERVLLRDRVVEHIDEIKNSSHPQHYWAKYFDCTQPQIHVVFKQLGLTNEVIDKRSQEAITRRYDQCRKVLGYIVEHGGYVTHAIEALGMKMAPQFVRDYAQSIGFDLTHYQFAYQEYGAWLTLPGPWRHQLPCNYHVPAVCRSCGAVKTLQLSNARSGKSTCCSDCASSTRIHSQVLNASTGETYRSIMGWAKAIGRFDEYQKLRIKLKRAGQLTVDGAEYKLITN
jgi:hypothetical protein